MDQNQLTELLFQAATQHQGGRLQAAQEGYARVLALAPRNPEANHNSGVLAMQTGKGLSVALPFFRGAWEADPAHQQHWLSYLRALVQTGDMENAQNVLAAGNRHGLRGPDLELLKPRIAPPPAPAAAPNNSSQIDLKADARILARLLDERNFDAAEQAARKLTAAHPGHGLGWKVLGEALFAQNRFREALEATERAARISPTDPELHSTLSNLLAELGLLREAEIALRRGLTLKPDHLPAQQALARLSLRGYRYAEAETAARKLLSQDAHSIAAWLILGESLFEQSRAADAEAAFREALRLHPGQTDAYRRLGNMLFLEGRETELSALSRQMRLDAPDYADAAADLARSLLRSGKLAQASEVFAQALELRPDDLALRDSWLFCCNYLAQLPPQELYDQARIYGEIASLAARPFAAWDCAPSTSKLRVGLVSGDLREHPVGYFLERVIANSDPTRIEWIVYATNRASDALSTRLQPQLSGWKVLAGLNDEDAARLIHQDAPHVLIDLAGHTADNRLSVFAWRPAPVQVSWLGYFATTGLPQMDYFLADRIGVPEESRHYFSEQVRYLPDTRLCFSPPEDAP